MESCIAAAEEGIRVKCIQIVHSMLKEEVEKAQSLLSSSHDKAVKVIISNVSIIIYRYFYISIYLFFFKS